ncbi:MAG: exonuclease SbcCD subunit D C-terminal domain-containing protein [Cyclobacteriaceae bacterium]|nr:exonuclease SbcCD subunit D C-terminal domain-containing protein [Cyclobacteriaceae bacterium]
MIILHTADWHLGKKLYDYDLSGIQSQYLDWLANYLKSEKVDYLLISGDVFDLANPSSDSLRLYYEFLHTAMQTGTRLIITGGNHDSPLVLNAPARLLHYMQVFVVGCLSENIDEMIFPLKNPEGDVEAVVIGMPFLRDRDLRRSVAGQGYQERIESVREGIKLRYMELSERARNLYPNVPTIAMGHLFVQNSVVSESEREIQVGNQAAFSTANFPTDLQYIALGHIHRPQAFGEKGNMRYSGSPYPLSFSEKDDNKEMVRIDIVDGEIDIRTVEVPAFAELRSIAGSLAEVRTQAENLENAENLPILLELKISEEVYKPEFLQERDQIISEIKQKTGIEVVATRIEFADQEQMVREKLRQTETIHEIKPADVFEILLKSYPQEEIGDLLATFASLEEEIHQEMQNEERL